MLNSGKMWSSSYYVPDSRLANLRELKSKKTLPWVPRVSQPSRTQKCTDDMLIDVWPQDVEQHQKSIYLFLILFVLLEREGKGES